MVRKHGRDASWWHNISPARGKALEQRNAEVSTAAEQGSFFTSTMCECWATTADGALDVTRETRLFIAAMVGREYMIAQTAIHGGRHSGTMHHVSLQLLISLQGPGTFLRVLTLWWSYNKKLWNWMKISCALQGMYKQTRVSEKSIVALGLRWVQGLGSLRWFWARQTRVPQATENMVARIPVNATVSLAK